MGAATVTVLAAVAAGVACLYLALPLPWLLGAILSTSALAIRGIAPFGHPVGIPTILRAFAVPVIGVSIGTAMTPEVLEQAAGWWPSLLAIVVFIPIVHLIAFWLAQRNRAIDRKTAYYGTMPGGFVESVQMAAEGGADEALVSVMQLLRLMICLILIPLGFAVLTGGAVGSAGGMVIGSAGLSLMDWVILTAAGAGGALVGRAIGFPAWVITGPVLASCVIHLVGWVEGGPPGWLVAVTQLVIGITVGQRLVGRDQRLLLRAAQVAMVAVPAMLAVTAVFALLLRRFTEDGWQAVFLAFAPGGLAEMALVALSLEIGAVYVTVHHILRIILSVVWAKFAARRVIGPGGEPK